MSPEVIGSDATLFRQQPWFSASFGVGGGRRPRPRVPGAPSRWLSVSGEHITDPITVGTLRALAQRNGNGYGFVWVDLSFLESQSPPGLMHFPGPPGIFVPLNFRFTTARLYGHESHSPLNAIWFALAIFIPFCFM